jgi:hypothetical protein
MYVHVKNVSETRNLKYKMSQKTAFKRNQYDCVKLFYTQQYGAGIKLCQRLTAVLYATTTANQSCRLDDNAKHVLRLHRGNCII